MASHIAPARQAADDKTTDKEVAPILLDPEKEKVLRRALRLVDSNRKNLANTQEDSKALAFLCDNVARLLPEYALEQLAFRIEALSQDGASTDWDISGLELEAAFPKNKAKMPLMIYDAARTLCSGWRIVHLEELDTDDGARFSLELMKRKHRVRVCASASTLPLALCAAACRALAHDKAHPLLPSPPAADEDDAPFPGYRKRNESKD